MCLRTSSITVKIHALHVLVLRLLHFLFMVTAIHLHLHIVVLFDLLHPAAMAVQLHLVSLMTLSFHSVTLHLLHSHLFICTMASLLLLHALLGLLGGVVLLVILTVGLSGLRVRLQGGRHHFFCIHSSLSLLLGILFVAHSEDA